MKEGEHYKEMGLDVYGYAMLNPQIDYLRMNIIKYASRKKEGCERTDLIKIIKTANRLLNELDKGRNR